jgi:hypothetical protein
MEKGSQKGREKRWKKGAPAGGFTVALFSSLFHTLFFPFPAKFQVGPHFCWSSTLFVLLIEKRGGNRAKTKRMAKRAKKSEKKGGKRATVNNPNLARRKSALEFQHRAPLWCIYISNIDIL